MHSISQDVVTIDKLEPVRKYVPSDDYTEGVSVNTYGDFFPTTRAQDVLFFELTPENAGVAETPLEGNATRGSCLVFATSEKCLDNTCSELSRNDVPQTIYSWQPVDQAWLDTGPGAGNEDGVGVITGNGVMSLAHFSPDGTQDMIIPASFSSDASSALFPTTQCGVVWRY